jgi:hypothetical protein
VSYLAVNKKVEVNEKLGSGSNALRDHKWYLLKSGPPSGDLQFLF